MYYIEKYGLDDHFEMSSQSDGKSHVVWLYGLLSYAQSIEPQLVNKWQQVFNAALENRKHKNPSRATEEG